ncbi:hypothetical protein BDR06DRAFT_977467 [Suillus hirtellus]|nr:hypothetical protein BDR06DRAFT_977467 [Suillus hirtellus]
MDSSTKTYSPCASTELYLPLAIVPLQDAIAMLASPNHGSMTNGTPLPSIKQPSLNPSSNCIIITQNNYIMEGGTINIYSSHCNSSTTAKLERVTATAEPMPFKAPSAMQAETPEHSRESTVLSGNMFDECIMINIGSPNCTGAVEWSKG